MQYPQLAADANVPQWIQHIDADLARKAYITGDFYRRTGKRAEAQEHFTAATTMYREMDMQFWLEQAEAYIRELA